MIQSIESRIKGRTLWHKRESPNQPVGSLGDLIVLTESRQKFRQRGGVTLPRYGSGDGKRTETVVRHLVENRWPFRLHSTYDETIPN
jgi:hypothetical protein